ncbi:glycosyltransferase family 4 protein [Lonsdalea quercina]|uniref:glycosyltransferase family 4 protein n=1 Tax=Lonsdalea quercina TaxID=71657 RepID=UPI0039757352
MKVVFDCTALNNWVGKPTGIQRVINELGVSLVDVMPNAVTVIFDAAGDCYNYCPDTRKTGEQVFLENGDMIFASGHDWDYPEHFDHICNYVARGIKFGLLIYDIIPIKFPFTYTQEFVERFENWLKRAIQLADICFTISHSTRKDVLGYAEHLGLVINGINILRIGDNIPANEDNVSARVKNKIAEDYILSVGTIEFRKNHITLLNAYRYMIQNLGINVPKLYIAGRQGLFDAYVSIQVEGDPVLKGKVEILSDLSDSDIGALYASALFTVYPSIYEGWGLPVAESLCYGVPCITSRSSSMLEIAPELTPFADPLMTNEWVEKVSEWIEFPDRLASVREQIKSQYHRVSWHDTACYLREHLDVIGNQIAKRETGQENSF